MHGHAAGRFPGVIGKMFTGFDVVLIAVRPVKRDLLTAVRNSITLTFGVTALGDKVAILPVTVEKGVQVIVNSDPQGFVISCRCCLLPNCQVLLARLGIMVLDQISFRIDGIVTDLQNLLPGDF